MNNFKHHNKGLKDMESWYLCIYVFLCTLNYYWMLWIFSGEYVCVGLDIVCVFSKFVKKLHNKN